MSGRPKASSRALRQMLRPREVLRRMPQLDYDALKYIGASRKCRVRDPRNRRCHLYDYAAVRKAITKPKGMLTQNELLIFLKDRGLDVSRETLHNWIRNCDILGRAFTTVAPQGPGHRLYSIRDAEKVLKLVRPCPPEGEVDRFEDKGLAWVWVHDASKMINQAMEKAGISFTVCAGMIATTYCKKEKGGCPALGGGVVKSRDGWVYNLKADRAFRRPYVAQASVQELIAAVTEIHRVTKTPLAQKQNLTRDEIATEFPGFGKVNKRFLRRYTEKPHPATKKKLVPGTEKRLVVGGGGGAGLIRALSVWTRESLKELYTALGLDPVQKNGDVSPRLVDGRIGLNDVATKEEVPRRLFQYWARFNCPYGTVDAKKQVRGIGSPHGKTSEMAFLPGGATDAATTYKKCRETAKAGLSGVYQDPHDQKVYRSGYAARKKYPDGGITNGLLTLCRARETAALNGKKIDKLTVTIPDGPLGILQEVHVHLDEDLKRLADWSKARARLDAPKWDGEPDFVDKEGGWVTWGRIKHFDGLDYGTVHSRVLKKAGLPELDGEAPRGRPEYIPGGKRLGGTWIYHMDDAARMGAARAGKPLPAPRWPRPAKHGGPALAGTNGHEPVRVHIVGSDGPLPVRDERREAAATAAAAERRRGRPITDAAQERHRRHRELVADWLRWSAAGGSKKDFAAERGLTEAEIDEARRCRCRTR